jgi:conserved domain protein
MNEFQTKAINAARTVLLNELYCSADRLEPSDMYVVWFCKTLQNWKALVSGVHIKEYIEVTYNGDKKETYVDVYQKACNRCLKDGGDEDCQ